METIFLKNSEEILYLVSGKKDNLKGCLKEGFSMMTSNTSEGAGEKHIPVVEKSGNKVTVKVGSIFHPMTQEHSITWIFLETKRGGQFARLDADGQPVAEFVLSDGEEAVAAYAYCNLHGFWKTSISS